VIHKRILDAAESEPSASMEELATDIGGASTELVERVLDEYGDPGGTESVPDEAHARADRGCGVDGSGIPDTTDVGTDEHMDEHTDENGESTWARNGTDRDARTIENGRSDGAYAELSDGQLRALRLVERNPDATQGDIAAEFDVTRATISRWLNDVPGFEWSRRGEIATRILNGDANGKANDRGVPDGSGGDEAGGHGSGDDEVGAGGAETERPEALDRRLERIEGRIDRLEAGAGTEASAGVDPELAHKVVHACLNSDRISEAEELHLLKELMG
jgi:hypothetical protein